MVDRKMLRRVAAILYHRRAGFSANGMGVWRVPEDRILEVGGRMAAVRGDLPLLPAPHLRGLALQRLHHGPRPLQGGVRRDPRRRSPRARPARRRSRRPLLLDRVQEDPPPLLHRRLRRAGRRSTHRPLRGALRAGAGGDARRGQLPGPGDAADRPQPDLHRARRGPLHLGRRRQPLRRLGLLLGAADPRPRRSARRRGDPPGRRSRDQLRRADRGRGRAGRRGRRAASRASRWCG